VEEQRAREGGVGVDVGRGIGGREGGKLLEETLSQERGRSVYRGGWAIKRRPGKLPAARM